MSMMTTSSLGDDFLGLDLVMMFPAAKYAMINSLLSFLGFKNFIYPPFVGVDRFGSSLYAGRWDWGSA